MKTLTRLFVLIICCNFVLTSLVTEARTGSRFRSGGVSHGSFSSPRGSSGSGFYGRPQQHQYAPYQRPGSNNPYTSRNTAPYQTRSFWQNHPIMSGLLAGLAGSWLGNMFFHNTAQNPADKNQPANPSDIGAWLGSKLPLIILIVLAYLIYRRYQKSKQQSSYRDISSKDSSYSTRNYSDKDFMSNYAGQQTANVEINDLDYQKFAQALFAVQNAWSQNDLAKLRQLTSAELFDYFSQNLSENSNEGVTNKIEDVQVIKQDLQDAWREQNEDYAQIKITWLAKDYYIRKGRNPSDADYIAGGDPNNAVSNTELWTFVRRDGGTWTLTGIEQV